MESAPDKTMNVSANNALERLRAMCKGPRDGVLLRMTLANELLTQGDAVAAIVELQRALEFNPDYSAAWKLLGKTLTDVGETLSATTAYRKGIDAAIRRGDKQAEKEMNVFLRRLEKR